MFELFEKKGGVFLTSHQQFVEKLNRIRVFIFDWDGVFTDGSKDAQLQSRFNESDSLGLNLLRFSYFLNHQQPPIIAFISGEKNISAFTLANRENIHFHYFKVPHKVLAFDHLCKNLNIQKEETAFVFDDILDIGIAGQCGVRLYVKKCAGVMFNEYIVKNKLADYITFSDGSTNAVREISELSMHTYNNFDAVLTHRIQFSAKYQEYLSLKKQITPTNYTFNNGTIIQSKE